MNEEQFLDLLEVLDRIAKALESQGTRPPSKNDNWRSEPASEKQKALMSKQGIPYNDSITKGQASDLIDGYFNSKKRG